MLAKMLGRTQRGRWFTLASALLFTAGCAGAAAAGPEPATAEDSVWGDEAAMAQAANGEEAAPDVQIQTVAGAEYADTDATALTAFRSELDPYGRWAEDPVYGTVWIPNPAAVGTDFAPYQTSGHWALTADSQWMWVSDYPWGWATFHYGRWVWIPSTGWAWIPGRTYAPAWVVWRVGDPGYDYIGWAPMPPSYYWYGGVAVGLWVVPPTPYCFVQTNYIFDGDVHRHMVGGHDVATAASHSRNYAPATPRPGGARHGAQPHGPTMADARIPASAAPRVAAEPHPKALAMASPQGHRAGASPVPAISRTSAPNLRPAVAQPRLHSAPMSVSRPTYRGQGAQTIAPNRLARPLTGGPAYSSGGAPSWQSNRFSNSPRPSYGMQSGESSYRPSYSSRPSYSPSFGRSSPSMSSSAPHFSPRPSGGVSPRPSGGAFGGSKPRGGGGGGRRGR